MPQACAARNTFGVVLALPSLPRTISFMNIQCPGKTNDCWNAHLERSTIGVRGASRICKALKNCSSSSVSLLDSEVFLEAPLRSDFFSCVALRTTFELSSIIRTWSTSLKPLHAFPLFLHRVHTGMIRSHPFLARRHGLHASSIISFLDRLGLIQPLTHLRSTCLETPCLSTYLEIPFYPNNLSSPILCNDSSRLQNAARPRGFFILRHREATTCWNS